MFDQLRLLIAVVVVVAAGMPGTAQQPNPKEQYLSLVKSMRAEREKLGSGVCRITGRHMSWRKDQKEPVFDGLLSILTAFDGKKMRFDRTQPDWVFDPASIQVDPKDPSKIVSAKSKKGTLVCHFCDDGNKAAFWKEDAGPQINVLASRGGEGRNPMGNTALGFFDVRALGLYYYLALEHQTILKDLFDGYEKISLTPTVDRVGPNIRLISWAGPPEKPDFDVRIWIDASKGYTPFRSVMRDGQGRQGQPRDSWPVTEASETNWQQMGSVWVPVKHKCRIDLGWSMEVQFDLAWENVNKPIPARMFQYQAFDALDYVGVIDSSSGRPVVVKPLGQAPQVGPKQPKDPKPNK